MKNLLKYVKFFAYLPNERYADYDFPLYFAFLRINYSKILLYVNISHQIYTGKADKTDCGSVSVGLGEKVVEHLCEALKGSNYHVAFDNFFSLYDIMEKLYAWNIYATGTVRSHRKRSSSK